MLVGCLKSSERRTNFEVKEKNWILSHMLYTQLMSICDIQATEQLMCVNLFSDAEKGSGRDASVWTVESKQV